MQSDILNFRQLLKWNQKSKNNILTSRKFPDGRDLNRVFLGSPKGSLASQFAHEFKKEIAQFIDYVIDFHAGAAHRVNIAQTRCLFDDEKTLQEEVPEKLNIEAL